MELTNILTGDVEPVVRRDSGCEGMEVALVTRPDGAVIYSKTEGELTQEIYDAPWNVGCAFVRPAYVPVLIEALPAAVGEAGCGSLGDALRNFFADEERMPSDLLDLLDARAIPYSYRTFNTYAALFRPEE